MAKEIVPVSRAGKIAGLLDDGNAKASATLTVGSIVWKILAYSEHIDFLLSIRGEKFSMIFNFFETAGWWLLAGAGVLWFLATRIQEKKTPEPLNWAFVISCAVVAFLFGSLITVKSSGAVPQILISWGGNAVQCTGGFDLSQLQTFRDNYKLYLICGINDPAIDMLEDPRILISNPFDIRPGGIDIVANYSKRIDDLKNIPAGQVISLWHIPVIMPAGISRDKISTLADVIALGGKILDQRFYK